MTYQQRIKIVQTDAQSLKLGGNRRAGSWTKVRHDVSTFSVAFMLAILIGMPKGGFKLGTLPITFSYILIAVAAFCTAMLRSDRLGRKRIAIYFCTLPLAGICITKVIASPSTAISWTISLVVTVAVIPALFLLPLAPSIHYSFHARRKMLRAVVFAVCAFGATDFFTRNFEKTPLEVPYVTVNVDDLGQLNDKHNDRGRFIKLISTYSNGNIFGICMCVLAPILLWMGANRFQVFALSICMFLTLSRTVWFGLVLLAFLWQVIYRKRTGTVFFIPLFVLTAAAIGYIGIAVLGTSSDFLFDSTLGGRLSVEHESTIAFLDAAPFYGLGEMTYNEFAYNFGLIGLAAFLLWLWSPILLLIMNWRMTKRSPLARACLVSMLCYAVICAIDGAFLLIPVMALYWCAAGVSIVEIEKQFSVSRRVSQYGRGVMPLTDYAGSTV